MIKHYFSIIKKVSFDTMHIALGTCEMLEIQLE